MSSPTNNQNRFVVGFMFTETAHHVLLRLKNKPEWQKGRLNGVGGRIEGEEPTLNAMCREFHEETGLITHQADWTLFHSERFFNTMLTPDACVNFYYASMRMAQLAEAQQFYDETGEQNFLVPIAAFSLGVVSPEVIDNLNYLIPKARILRGTPKAHWPIIKVER